MKKKPPFLSFSPPSIGPEEVKAVVEALRSPWITTGPKTKQFERVFQKYVGAKAALAVNSCTAALHLALVASGIGPGDEVITTPMTFCSGVNVIEHAGSRPVFADVDPETLNIDPEKIEVILKNKARRRRAKAVIPVHYGGHPCDLGKIYNIARRYGLRVIEDAAHSLPAKFKGRKIGSFPGFTAFSFYATKNMTTAEGGMLTGPPALIEKARILSLHGMSRDAWKRYSAKGSWYYEVREAGFKYNMTDLQAALGMEQLKKLGGFQARRRALVRIYQRAFGVMDELQIPVERPGIRHAWHLYPLRLHLDRLRINRDQFIEELTRRGIGASVHFIPVPMHPYYKKKYGYRPSDFPVAFREFSRLVSLPLHPRLSDSAIDRIISSVREIVKKHSRKKYA